MLLLALMAAVATPSRLPPVDECKDDRTFVQFRASLRRTIDARDSKTLLSLVADDVHASLGGHVGKSDFIELWGLKQPQTSRLWKELEAALRLGCSMKNGVATAPSFEDQLGGARDPFETLIALPGTVLHRAPSDKSPS
ncbi:MAG TPA: hypothetical protein VJ775_05030, partial [Sphingomicrobium sp.]|nr:hypothetical protein [Sphingomicrobium sp.]